MLYVAHASLVLPSTDIYAPAVKALLSLLAVEHSSLSQKERVRAVGREEGGDDGGSGNQKQLHLGNVRVAMIEALFDGSPLICKGSNRPSEPAWFWTKLSPIRSDCKGCPRMEWRVIVVRCPIHGLSLIVLLFGPSKIDPRRFNKTQCHVTAIGWPCSARAAMELDFRVCGKGNSFGHETLDSVFIS